MPRDANYKDYDFQMSMDAKKQTRFQLVGIHEDGSKDILKEFDSIPFESERAFAAPKDDKKEGGASVAKMGGAFLLGLIIGGVVVYFIMKARENKKVVQMQAPQAMPPIQYSEAIRVVPEPDWRRARSEEGMWIGDYDKDIFVRD